MKRYVVTGANAGIGLAIAESLARERRAVFMVCRDPRRGAAALERVRGQAGRGAEVELILGDLSTVASTERAADAIEGVQPHVLIHNAGRWPTRRERNEEGFELGFAVNHLAPFVLNERLLPGLRRVGQGRIVQVTAGLYVKGRIDLEGTPTGERFGVMRTYADTKLWNLLATLELSRREASSDLAVVAVHPGVVRTGLGEHGHWMVPVLRVFKRFWLSPAEGARGPVRAAVDPALAGVKGAYFDQQERAMLAPVAEDRQLAARVWARTQELRAGARRDRGDAGRRTG